MLKQYMEMQALREANWKKSFDFQIEQYLERLKMDFQKAFLDKGHYVDLNGETRIPLEQEIAAKARAEEEEKYEFILHRPLDTFINQWLKDETKNFLVILGEYGTGKTTFLRHLSHLLASNRLEPGSPKGISDEKNRIPLYFPLRDFEKKIEPFVVNQFNTAGITDIDFSGFGQRIEDKEINHFIKEHTPDEETLLSMVKNSDDLLEEKLWQGSNAASILLRMDKAALKGHDLSGRWFKELDFQQCDLTGTNFVNARLINCEFDRSILSACLKNINFEGSVVSLSNLNLTDISITKEFNKVGFIYLNSNKLTDLTPLQELTELMVLDLTNNPVTDLTLLYGLKSLSLLFFDGILTAKKEKNLKPYYRI